MRSEELTDVGSEDRRGLNDLDESLVYVSRD